MATEYGIDTSKLCTHIAQRAIDRLLDFAEAKVKEKWARRLIPLTPGLRNMVDMRHAVA